MASESTPRAGTPISSHERFAMRSSVEVVGANSGVPCSLLLPEAERPSTLQVPLPDVGLSLVRHALGLATYVETEAGRELLNGWLTPAEMQATQLIAMVNQMLQEPEAVRTVVVAT